MRPLFASDIPTTGSAMVFAVYPGQIGAICSNSTESYRGTLRVDRTRYYLGNGGIHASLNGGSGREFSHRLRFRGIAVSIGQTRLKNIFARDGMANPSQDVIVTQNVLFSVLVGQKRTKSARAAIVRVGVNPDVPSLIGKSCAC